MWVDSSLSDDGGCVVVSVLAVVVNACGCLVWLLKRVVVGKHVCVLDESEREHHRKKVEIVRANVHANRTAHHRQSLSIASVTAYGTFIPNATVSTD